MATSIYLGNPPENIKKWIIADAERKYQEMLKTPLTFTAEETGAKFSLKSSYGPDVTLETSTTGEEGSWQPYTVGTEITLANIGDKIMFRNSSNSIQVMSDGSYNRFDINSGKIAASGNIMFLMDKTGELRDLSGKNWCYSNMFSDCSSLTKAPALPATTLADNCYAHMFTRCTSLTQAPVLPATTLADNCYECMFSDCSSLTKAPALPATTLASYCYSSMFSSCASLTQAPELPATTLTDYCYELMFVNCTSLTQALVLPATTLARGCYKGVLQNCTDIPEPKYKMPNLTFDEAATKIQNNWIFGDSGTYTVQCSDKILIATFDEGNWEWTITEK